MTTKDQQIKELQREVYYLKRQVSDRSNMKFIGDTVFTVIGQITEDCTGIPIELILGHSRRRELVVLRHIIINILREYTALSLKSIAFIIGNRDHSTIIHALRKHDDMMFTKDVYYVDMYMKIRDSFIFKMRLMQDNNLEPVINAS